MEIYGCPIKTIRSGIHEILNINWGSRLAAAVVVWGATAYHYINTGMSISMIAFTLFVIAYALKNHAIPKVTLHKIFYGRSLYFMPACLFPRCFIWTILEICMADHIVFCLIL